MGSALSQGKWRVPGICLLIKTRLEQENKYVCIFICDYLKAAQQSQHQHYFGYFLNLNFQAEI